MCAQLLMLWVPGDRLPGQGMPSPTQTTQPPGKLGLSCQVYFGKKLFGSLRKHISQKKIPEMIIKQTCTREQLHDLPPRGEPCLQQSPELSRQRWAQPSSWVVLNKLLCLSGGAQGLHGAGALAYFLSIYKAVRRDREQNDVGARN